MRVLILVSVHDKPYGGHYHTTLAYFNALRNSFRDTKLLVIGNENPHWITNLGIQAEFVRYNGLNLVSAYKKVAKSAEDYEILHAFDEFAYFFIRSIVEKKVICTRCGGPNPEKRYFPKVSNLVCLSRENKIFFERSSKIENCILLPNRVPPFEINLELCANARANYDIDSSKLVLLRISRIDAYYLKSIEQTITLGKELSKIGGEIEVIILGAVYDKKLFDELNSRYSHVKFISDEKYTKDAKRVLGLADIVVGTGRSLMEAALKGKVMFAPVKNRDTPELMTKENIKHFLNTNFSERTIVNTSRETSLEYLKTLVEELSVLKDYKVWITDYAKKTFLLESCPEKLEQFYKNASVEKCSFDFYRQMIRVTSVFLRFSLRKWFESSSHN